MEKVAQIIESALNSGITELSEFESKKIVAEYGLPIVRERLVLDLPQGLDAAQDMGFPLALKACSPSLSHKTEAGLVILNIGSQSELSDAFTAMKANPSAPDGTQFLVQRMVKGTRELVLGMIRDPLFGPCVMFGLGGLFTEVLGQVCFRMAPLSLDEAREMLEETSAGALLGFMRGMKPVDKDSLAQCLVNLGELAVEHPEISAVDINPMVIEDGNPIAVDGLVVLGKPPQARQAQAPAAPNLDAFFQPKDVAILGASAVPGKAGNDVVRNIIDNGYPGKLYLVNPKGGEILGHQVYSSLDDLPEGIDLGIIILPAHLNPGAIRQCGAKGIKALVLAAGGFAEVDDAGRDLQRDLTQAISETGVRVLGPNTSGHTSMPARLTSSFFPLGEIPSGPISFIAQTGNFATHSMRYITTAQNFGVSRVIGLGNKVDVEESEVLEYLGNDAETKAILLYLESFKDPARFVSVAKVVTRHKPVILLKGGRTDSGAKAAIAHTAAMASDQRIVEGALKQAGIVQVDKYSDLFHVGKALASMPMPSGSRVSILGPSGAMLVVMSDLCRELGLEVPPLQKATLQRLRDISPPLIRMRNPVDIWGAVTKNGIEFSYSHGMDAVLNDPNIDALVVVLMLTTRTGIPSLDFIVEMAGQHDKPIYVSFSGEHEHMESAKAYLEPRGIPTYPLIEQPLEVLGILSRCLNTLKPGATG